jgi:hypothetical protein
MQNYDIRPVRLAYQPPANSTFLSEQTSYQQPARTSQQCSSLRTNQHQPSATSQPNRLIIHLVRFCDVLYIELCIDHANIFIKSSQENHKYMFGIPVFSLDLPALPTGYRSLPTGKPISYRLNCRFDLKI